MTEKQRIPEQMALYHYRAGGDAEATVHRREPTRRISQALQVPRTLERIVTIPEADPSTAWQTFSQRRAQQQRARAKPKAHAELVPRTFAQTGMRASSGRIPAVHRPLPYYISPVPIRSGRLPARRGLLWRFLSIFALGVMLVLAIYIPMSSSAFRVEHVNVVGTRNAALIQHIQRIGMQDQNIFVLNVTAFKDRIIASPLVASADLSKQWPDRLTVTVVERQPALLWQTANATYSIDRQGVVIAAISGAGGSASPALVVERMSQARPDNLRPGAHVDQHNVAFAVNVLQRLPQLLGNQTFKLFFDGTMYASANSQSAGMIGSRGSYIVESPDGWKAYLGNAYDANSLDNRLLELHAILALAQRQQMHVSTIDLRYGLRPVFALQ